VKPVLFVTGHAPAYRVGAFARLHEREQIELALFGGRSQHGGPNAPETLPFPHRHVRPHQLPELAASGDYRAVVCPTGGRLALLGAWSGARRGRIPLILWASLWAHPRSVAHTFSYLPLRHLYRSADALVTYGSHVSDYVRARGARNVHVAPQAVDNDFWRTQETAKPFERRWPQEAQTKFMFAGRAAREKGVEVLLAAWRESKLAEPDAALVLVGVGSDGRVRGGHARETGAEEVLRMDTVGPLELRNLYSAADVLVLPSIATATFREPWGLVANEAMNQGLAVIASDAVGAAAGGLVRDGENGLIVPAGDSRALAAALLRLAADRQLRTRMGAAAREDVLAFSYDAWAAGFSRALADVGLSRQN
jgi:glycosyltransferase involved in cell wall biosynthesis